jgi:hypothetical protein
MVPDTNTVINVAIISQYLATKDNLRNNFSGNQSIDKRLPRLLMNIRKSVQNQFISNPSDPTLSKTGEYLYGLCAPYSQAALAIIGNIAQLPPVITGPSNQSGDVGFTATFSVSVVSSLPVIYQWYDYLGNPILGATGASYSFVNAQLTDSGKTFFVRATNAAGSTVSGTATLTVAAALVGQYYQGSTDFSNQLSVGVDNVTFLGTFPIVTGQPFSVTFPHLVTTEYIVVKYPDTEPTKTSYLNPPPSGPDAGTIPSVALNVNSFGGSKYIFSRTGNTFGLNSVNGTVKFS